MSAPSVLALIQARMGSTRLPCKSLLCLHGKPLIDWITDRVRMATFVDALVVATPNTPANDPLEYHLRGKNIPVFRGSENDVLDRFYRAASANGAVDGGRRGGTAIVRICADNPLIWGPEIDNLIRHYRETPCDYAYNHIPRNNLYPDGLGAEILSFGLLRELAQQAVLPAHREHCLSYLWDNADKYSISTFDPADTRLHHPEIKLDMDTPEDYRELAIRPLHPQMPPEDILPLFL